MGFKLGVFGSFVRTLLSRTVSEMAEFIAPHISDNVDGWGPPLDEPPEKFADMPYAPFSKSDRLGRAADWFSHGRYGNRCVVDEWDSDVLVCVLFLCVCGSVRNGL